MVNFKNFEMSEDVSGKNVATKTAVMEDGEIKISVLNGDVYRLVDDARKNGKDLSYCFNDIVQLFNLALQDIELPEFSFEEKVLIANCMCGSAITSRFINCLELEVTDFIADGYKYFEDEEKGFTEEFRKNFIAKIYNLNYMQRIKLVHVIQSETMCV